MNVKRAGSAMVHKLTDNSKAVLCMGIRVSQAVPTTEPVNCGGCIAEEGTSIWSIPGGIPGKCNHKGYTNSCHECA